MATLFPRFHLSGRDERGHVASSLTIEMAHFDWTEEEIFSQ